MVSRVRNLTGLRARSHWYRWTDEACELELGFGFGSVSVVVEDDLMEVYLFRCCMERRMELGLVVR